MSRFAGLLAILSLSAVQADEASSNPLGKVLQLLGDLTVKVVADGEAEEKAYREYFQWCDETSATTANEVKTAKARKAKLEAGIDELAASIETSTSEIEELGGALAKSSDELADAKKIRDKEAVDFAAGEKELVDVIDTLDRAIGILQREMSKNPAALAQIDTTSMKNMIQSISTVVDAAAFNSRSNKKLMALVQAQQDAQEASDEADVGAPSAAVYKNQDGNIFEMLENLKDQAETELGDLRKEESTKKHNYEMLKQSLDDKTAAADKDMAEEKQNKAEAEEGKATAEGELETTTKDLKAAEEKLATTRSTCMTVAADHEASVHSRKEELKVLAEVTKILVETTGGAVEQTFSFVQVSAAAHGPAAVATMVKKLARTHRSAALAQLASRIQAVVKYGGANRADIFGKVKELITSMIGKLEKEAAEAATEKKFCDEEMAKTQAKNDDLEGDIEKLSAKKDQASAQSTKLKEQVKVLQEELGSIAEQQAELDKIRADENAAYKVAKADLGEGLAGVRKALEVLRDYYAAKDEEASMLQQPAKPTNFKKATGGADSIIGILEVCESDFAKNLADVETAESDAEEAYQKDTQANKVSTAEKTQDVKYQTQEYTGLDKTISELSADLDTVNAEHAAVLEYFGKLKERCVAKPESYAERKERRDSEIAGLQEALSILEGETAAFVQRKRGHMRGVLTA